MDDFKINEGTQNAITLLNYMQAHVLELRDENAKLFEKNQELLGDRTEYVKDSFFKLRREVAGLKEKLAEEAKYQEGNRKVNDMLNQEAARHLKEVEDLKGQLVRMRLALEGKDSRIEILTRDINNVRELRAVAEQRYVDEKNKNDHLEKMYAYQNEEINILRHNIMRLSSNQLTAAQKEKCDKLISEIERLRDNG